MQYFNIYYKYKERTIYIMGNTNNTYTKLNDTDQSLSTLKNRLNNIEKKIGSQFDVRVLNSIRSTMSKRHIDSQKKNHGYPISIRKNEFSATYKIPKKITQEHININFWFQKINNIKNHDKNILNTSIKKYMNNFAMTNAFLNDMVIASYLISDNKSAHLWLETLGIIFNLCKQDELLLLQTKEIRNTMLNLTKYLNYESVANLWILNLYAIFSCTDVTDIQELYNTKEIINSLVIISNYTDSLYVNLSFISFIIFKIVYENKENQDLFGTPETRNLLVKLSKYINSSEKLYIWCMAMHHIKHTHHNNQTLFNTKEVKNTILDVSRYANKSISICLWCKAIINDSINNDFIEPEKLKNALIYMSNYIDDFEAAAMWFLAINTITQNNNKNKTIFSTREILNAIINVSKYATEFMSVTWFSFMIRDIINDSNKHLFFSDNMVNIFDNILKNCFVKKTMHNYSLDSSSIITHTIYNEEEYDFKSTIMECIQTINAIRNTNITDGNITYGNIIEDKIIEGIIV